MMMQMQCAPPVSQAMMQPDSMQHVRIPFNLCAYRKPFRLLRVTAKITIKPCTRGLETPTKLSEVLRFLLLYMLLFYRMQ